MRFLPLALVSTRATFAAHVPGVKSHSSVSPPSPRSCKNIAFFFSSPSVPAPEWGTSVRNVRQSGILRLENRVPPELGRATRGHDPALGAALEQDGLRARARAVREGAERPCGARWEAVQHVIEAFTSTPVQRRREKIRQHSRCAMRVDIFKDVPSCPRSRRKYMS